jgi:hypothetical protein
MRGGTVGAGGVCSRAKASSLAQVLVPSAAAKLQPRIPGNVFVETLRPRLP